MEIQKRKDIMAPQETLQSETEATGPATAVPAPAVAASPAPMPLKSTTPAADGEAAMAQTSTSLKENDEVDEMQCLALSENAQGHALCPDEALVPVRLTKGITFAASGRVNAGKKNSRKRRNKKKKNNVYIPWPLILQTRASSAAPVLSPSPLVRDLPGDPSGASDGYSEEDISILDWPSQGLPDPLSSALGEAETSLKKVSLESPGEKDGEIEGPPQQITGQAWASSSDPDVAGTIYAWDFPISDGEDDVEDARTNAKVEAEQMLDISWSGSSWAEASSSLAALQDASLEESFDVDNWADITKKRRRRRKGKKEKDIKAYRWFMTLQSWEAMEEAHSFLIEKAAPIASAKVNVKQRRRRPHCKGKKKSLMAQAGTSGSVTADQTSFEGDPNVKKAHPKCNKRRHGKQEKGDGIPPQSSEKPSLGSPKRLPGEQNLPHSTVRDLSRQGDCGDYEELSSKEKMGALTKPHCSTDTVLE